MRTGNGDFQYEVIHDWAKLPAGYNFGCASDGACDSKGNVYVFARNEHPVLIFDRDGNFLRSWGEGVFTRAHGILITPQDVAFCVDDQDHTVRKCTLDGEIMMTLGTKGQASDTGYDGNDWKTIKRAGPPFNGPTSVALTPDGDFYASDGYGNSRVHKFSADGKLQFSWGEPGSGPGQFSIVHTVCTDRNGTVYVADRENDRIQVFDPDGKFITEWTDLCRPNGLFMGFDGNFYVTELARSASADHPFIPPRVSIFNTDGKLLARWGGEDLSIHGNFFAPHGIWGDRSGDLYIGELGVATHRGNIPAGYPFVHKLVRV